MRRVDGKVALVTGAARGQGRSHAIRLGSEGAHLVLVDVGSPMRTTPYGLASADDLNETAALVERVGASVRTAVADVRDRGALDEIVRDAIGQFGRLDIVVANAGISGVGVLWELSRDEWQTMLDINVTGTWNTLSAAVPAMIAAGRGGSLITISSTAGLTGVTPGMGHYATTKHAVTGLARAFAVELAPYSIRSNSIHTGTVRTPMVDNALGRSLYTGTTTPTESEFGEALTRLNALPVPWLEPEDVSNAVLYLAGDESRYVTGTQVVIDAGNTFPFKAPHLGSGAASAG